MEGCCRVGVEMEEGYCPVGVGMEEACCPTMQGGGCFPEGCCPVEIEWGCSVGVEMRLGMRMGMAQLLGSDSPCSDSQGRKVMGACW